MKLIFEDKIMRAVLSISLISGSILFYRAVLIRAFSVKPQYAHSSSMPALHSQSPTRSPAISDPAPSDIPIVGPAEYFPDTVPEDIEPDIVSPPDQASPVIQANDSVSSYTPSDNENRIPIQRTRPKLGKNEWLVGNGAGADSAELAAVLNNVVSDDVIILTTSDHVLNLSEIQAEKIEIRGESKTPIKISLKKKYRVQFRQLTLKNIEINFSDDYFSFSGDLVLNLENVKINARKNDISFSGTTVLSVKDSTFSGISWSFRDKSKGKFERTFMDKAFTFFTLSDSAQVEIRDSQFYEFSNVAFYSRSSLASLVAENIQVTNGKYAFSGVFDSLSQIKNGKFKDLREMNLISSSIDCKLCEKYNIQR